MGVTCDGEREVLGIWWQRPRREVLAGGLDDLRRRGAQDVLIACVDGLKGFPEAIEATFPQAWVQTCIVHLIRASLRYVNYRDLKKVASALRPIYTAHNADRHSSSSSASTAVGARYPRPCGRGGRLAARHTVSLVARGAASRRLHDEHDLGDSPPDPQGDQDPRTLPRPTGRDQADLLGDHEGRRQVATQPHLERTRAA